MIEIRLEIETSDAPHIAEALNVDNKGYPIECKSSEGKIVCRIAGDDCGALKNVMDDMLACISATEG